MGKRVGRVHPDLADAKNPRLTRHPVLRGGVGADFGFANEFRLKLTPDDRAGDYHITQLYPPTHRP